MTGNIPDTVVILRDQAEEFPPCQQLYSCQRWSPKVGYGRLKSGMKVGGVTSRNTLDCADSSRAVHMTSCTRHCLPVAPSHLSPVPRAWNLSPRFVSLFGLSSYVLFPFTFVSLCDLSVYDLVSVMSVCFPVPVHFHLNT